jgi:hypothetical protein
MEIESMEKFLLEPSRRDVATSMFSPLLKEEGL